MEAMTFLPATPSGLRLVHGEVVPLGADDAGLDLDVDGTGGSLFDLDVDPARAPLPEPLFD